MELQEQGLYGQESEKKAFLHLWGERIYRFFYNIWPGVNRFINMIFYHAFRIIRGFFKIAMEQFQH